MPCPMVPTQSVFSRSSSKAPTAIVLPSNSGVWNDFQEPFINCCNPSPGPGTATPTHRELSPATARLVTPSALFPLRPRGAYTVDVSDFHRTSDSEVPIQKFPDASSAKDLSFAKRSASCLP
jgi:hypothetical protein